MFGINFNIGIDVPQQFKEIKLRGRRRWKWGRRESRGKQRKREGEMGGKRDRLSTYINKMKEEGESRQAKKMPKGLPDLV